MKPPKRQAEILTKPDQILQARSLLVQRYLDDDAIDPKAVSYHHGTPLTTDDRLDHSTFFGVIESGRIIAAARFIEYDAEKGPASFQPDWSDVPSEVIGWLETAYGYANLMEFATLAQQAGTTDASFELIRSMIQWSWLERPQKVWIFGLRSQDQKQLSRIYRVYFGKAMRCHAERVSLGSVFVPEYTFCSLDPGAAFEDFTERASRSPLAAKRLAFFSEGLPGGFNPDKFGSP